jgi:hypothetical protein
VWTLVVFEGIDGLERTGGPEDTGGPEGTGGPEDTGGVRLALALLGDETPDLSVVDALARLQLLCRRCGVHMHLKDTHFALEELLALTGLCQEMTS